MTPREFDDQIQIQLNVVNKILAASEQSQEAAQASISALDKLRTRVEISLDTLRQSVTDKIDSSAKDNAVETAKLLQKNFNQADEQAELAAMRYERAARWLGLKIFIILTGAILMILGIAWIILINYIPSRDEINTRRQELAAMEYRARDLEKLGANLKLGTCGGSPCFRTYEEDKKGPWGSNGETWRRVYTED